MEYIFDGIDGFNSWQFAVLAFGGIAVGLLLTALFRYWGMIGIVGGFPLFAYLSTNASLANRVTSDPVVSALLPVVPVLWLVIWVIIMVSIAGRTGITKIKGSGE